MPEHDTAIQLNLAQSEQEAKCRNNKQHPLTFQNKTLRVDTSSRLEASCLPYCAVADSNHSRWRLPEAEQNRIGPVSSGNWADSLAILMAKYNTQRS